MQAQNWLWLSNAHRGAAGAGRVAAATTGAASLALAVALPGRPTLHPTVSASIRYIHAAVPGCSDDIGPQRTRRPRPVGALFLLASPALFHPRNAGAFALLPSTP